MYTCKCLLASASNAFGTVGWAWSHERDWVSMLPQTHVELQGMLTGQLALGAEAPHYCHNIVRTWKSQSMLLKR